MYNQMIHAIIIGLLLVILAVLLNKKCQCTEKYSSLSGDDDTYYNWKSYAHNLYDKKRLSGFPYNYQPHEYNQNVSC